MQAQQYDFSLPASGAQQLAVVGSSVKLLSSTGPIQIQTDTGARVTIQAGQGIRNFDFNLITIVDKSGASNKGMILVADADMIDDRVTGEVSVVDGGMSRTKSNTAFWGAANVAAGAYYGTVMLYNNSTSNMLVVESVGIGLLGGVDSSMHIGFFGAGVAGWTGAGQPKSKKSGGLVSAYAQLWINTPGVSMFPWIVDIYCKTNSTNIIRMNEPMVITPGYGLCVDCGSLNQNMAANFEFYEAPI